MLILRGIRYLLHEAPAIAYAEREGYTPEVLDTSGETGKGAPQVDAALARIAQGGVTAIYGFSGGGYNAGHLFARLTTTQRADIERVVVLGAPGVRADQFPGVPLVTIWNDSTVAHMDMPDAFLIATA